MDYVLVTHLAADRTTLSYAVGEWAQVWPLSRLIRSMGAYFIRRQSRDALYRMVLRRYVQLATAGGVTQAIFPEGGLSLDGALRAPKMGLLSYIVDDLDLASRDVVFVPVALNYDRVLEDRVLIKTDKSRSDGFGASITHVTLAILKQLWLRLTGRFHRFGYAAVSFGRPLSLRQFPEFAGNAEALARALMDRIACHVPVLSVPLVAHLVLDGARTRADVELGFSRVQRRLGADQVHLARDNRDYAAEVGLRALLERGALAETGEGYSIRDHDLLRYYANSIRHLL